MAILKCKMCGGDLAFEPGATVCECAMCTYHQRAGALDNGVLLFYSLIHGKRNNFLAVQIDSYVAVSSIRQKESSSP